jgi:hypothetical protein
MDINKRVGKKVVAGGWNYGYWVYCNFTPRINAYKYINGKRLDEYYKLLDSLFKNDLAQYVIIDDIGVSKEMEQLLFKSEDYKFKIDTFYIEKDYKNPNPKYKMMLFKKEKILPNQDKLINQ